MTNSITSYTHAAGIPGGANYQAGDQFSINPNDHDLLPGERLAIAQIDTVNGSGVAQTTHMVDSGCAGYAVSTNPDGDSVTILTGVNSGQVVDATWFTLTVSSCTPGGGGGGTGYGNFLFR